MKFDPRWIPNILWTYEAYFAVNGWLVNKKVFMTRSPHLQNEHRRIANIIFMQDRAPPHIFQPVKNC